MAGGVHAVGSLRGGSGRMRVADPVAGCKHLSRRKLNAKVLHSHSHKAKL